MAVEDLETTEKNGLENVQRAKLFVGSYMATAWYGQDSRYQIAFDQRAILAKSFRSGPTECLELIHQSNAASWVVQWVAIDGRMESSIRCTINDLKVLHLAHH